MNNLIERIQAAGLPVDSYVQAYRMLSEREYNSSQFEDLIFELIGVQTIVPNDPKVFCCYLIQEAIRMNMADEEVITTDIIQVAHEKADAFIIRATPMTQATPEMSTDGIVSGVTTTTPKKKGGSSKKELCLALYTKNKELNRKDMVALFVKELGLTPAGASTYVHNCKHGIWQ